MFVVVVVVNVDVGLNGRRSVRSSSKTEKFVLEF